MLYFQKTKIPLTNAFLDAYRIETIYTIYAIYTIFPLICLCFPLLSMDGPYSSGLLSHWLGVRVPPRSLDKSLIY